MPRRARADSLTICYRKKQTGVCPVNDDEFRHNIVKVVCGSTPLSPRLSTATLTMLWRNLWWRQFFYSFPCRDCNLFCVIADRKSVLALVYSLLSQPLLVGEKRCVTTLISAAKETSWIKRCVISRCDLWGTSVDCRWQFELFVIHISAHFSAIY